MRLFAFTTAFVLIVATGCVVGIDPPPPTDKVPITGGVFSFGTETMCFDADVPERTCSASWTGLPKMWPTVDVVIPDFLIDAHEVTNKQYDYCVQMGNCDLPEYNNFTTGEVYYGNPLYDNYPVVNVTLDMAQKYCDFVGGRLPTEFEWERVAGGPSTIEMPKRFVPSDRVNYARIKTCGSKPAKINVKFCTSVVRPAAVGTSTDDFVAEYEGGPRVFDLVGNVAEWTAGRYFEKVTCDQELPPQCDCWACAATDETCKADCYTKCDACESNPDCFVQCEDESGAFGLPICIAYSEPVQMDSLVDTSSVGERVIKGGNYGTDVSRTCETTVAFRGRQLSKANSSPSVGFRCVYDPEDVASE